MSLYETNINGVRYVRREDYDALEKAAWDLYEVVNDMLDDGEYVTRKQIKKARDELGELLPAQRPEDSASPVASEEPCRGQ